MGSSAGSWGMFRASRRRRANRLLLPKDALEGEFMFEKIRKLFERRPEPTVRDMVALVAPLMVPAIQVLTSARPAYSHFGGDPKLPSTVAWPEKDGRKLDFLARLSLAELRAAHPVEWLPHEGALLFFYDIQEGPWGFDPKDRGSFAVLHVPDIVAPLADGPGESLLAWPARRGIAFRRIDIPPSWEHVGYEALGFGEREWEALSDLKAAPFGGRPVHQVAGFPDPVQGDHMEVECQLVTHGLYCGDSRGYKDPRAKALEAGAKDWKLLFQVDSDDELGLMWGDVGRLYFWVEESRARARDFGNAWMISQCH